MRALSLYLTDLKSDALIWIGVICVCVVLLLSGCAKKATAALPPGALNTFDADTYRTLTDAHAAIQSVQQDLASGKITADAGQKVVIDTAIDDVNAGDHLFAVYHATGTGDTTALTAAVSKVIGDLAALSTAFPAAAPAAK